VTQFQSSFSLAGIREHRRDILIAALCALVTGLAALPTGAQSRNESHQAVTAPGQLLAARNKQRAGEYSAARDILLGALSKASNSASLLNQLGSVRQDLGEYLEAERSYLQALSASAQTEGDPERLVILNNLGTLYFETGQYAKGDGVREQLEKLAAGNLEGHPAAAAKLLNVIASLEHARSRDDEAETHYARSLQLFQKANGTVTVDAALVKNNLGSLRLEAGRYESACDLFQQAIREIGIASGPEGPELIQPLVNLARCKNLSGYSNQAEPVARRAVELSMKVFGEAYPVTAGAMLEHAAALRRLRCKGPARDLEKRARTSLRNSSMKNLGAYTVSLRDLADAIR
jgi:tetratricopeptide (TPR) repeat protein